MLLLTISIPTYNRAEFLSKCLDSIHSQVDGNTEVIEIIVSNNNSHDNTNEVVERYKSLFRHFNYIVNEENIGPDRNIQQCFARAQGKYVWIFSDDDFLLPNYLIQIIKYLKSNDIGVMYLNSLWYNDIREIVYNESFTYKEYNTPLQYLYDVNYWMTFISGNIINKDAVIKSEISDSFHSTNLVQLGWTIPAIFSKEKNVVVQNKVVACKANNTGGYNLINVFGKNINQIMDHFIYLGYDKRMKGIVNNKLITDFFPRLIDPYSNSISNLKAMCKLLLIYWSYRAFWQLYILNRLIKWRVN